MRRYLGITIAIPIICVAMYILQITTPDLTSRFAIIPSKIMAGEYYRGFTGAFLHGSPMHLIMNMTAYTSLCSFLIRFYKESEVCGKLFLSIIGSSLAICFFGEQNTMTVGMSGGIYGLLALYVVTLFRTGIIQNEAVRRNIIQNLLANLVISLMPGVSMLGHLGGFVSGIIASLMVRI